MRRAHSSVVAPSPGRVPQPCHSKTRLWRSGVAALALLGAGCTSLGDQELFPKLDVPDTGASGCSTDPLPADLATLVEAKCGAGCHTGGAALGAFDFDPPTAAQKSINVKALNGSIMVIPGDPANSYLMKEMEGTGGGFMPPAGKMPEEELQLFRDWISALPPCSTGPVDEPDTVGGDAVVVPTDSTGPVPDTGSTACVVPPAVADLLNTACAGCHVGGAKLSGYDCDPARVIETNVNIASTTTGTILIVPGKPEASYLYMKVNEQGVGSNMPLGGQLTAVQKQILRDWIAGLSGCGGAP